MFYTEAISLVRKKLSFLQAEEAKASNAAQKFEIRQQIEEANQRLFELQEASSGSCNIKIASSRLFRGMNQGSELLIGREDNLAALDAAWSGTDKKNVVTIVAWGGIGKTSLVAHWATNKLAQIDHSGIEGYFDWSFYSQGTRRDGDPTGLSHATSADVFLKEALEFFGDSALASSNAGAWQKGERLAELIGRRRTLLILDGLEPLQDTHSGKLRDHALIALLRGLAAHSLGLCLVTTRQNLPEMNHWHQSTAPEWKLASLADEAGATLLTKLGVHGTKPEKCALCSRVKGHALTLTLLGNYLRKAHHGDIRRADSVDFQRVDEKDQGGHAFRMIAAYERWFEANNCHSELAVLRMLGLFDRPATPDCIAALRDSPIPGLTDTIARLTEDDWNEAVTHLVELNLVEEQAWEPRRILGYSAEDAKKAEGGEELGKPTTFEDHQSSIVNQRSLDAHPLIREFFANRLQQSAPAVWKMAHSQLFEHLRNSVPYWPEGVEALQPLYEAVAHGCCAGRHKDALCTVFRPRIQRGERFYSTKIFGLFGADLSAFHCFTVPPSETPVPGLTRKEAGSVLIGISFCLRSQGRLEEALIPIERAVTLFKACGDSKQTSIALRNESQILLTLGELDASLRYAREGVEYADRTNDLFERATSWSRLADALLQMGDIGGARSAFRTVAEIDNHQPPSQSVLNRYAGFVFAELLIEELDYEGAIRLSSAAQNWADHEGLPLAAGLHSVAIAKAMLCRVGSLESESRLAKVCTQAIKQLIAAGEVQHVPRALLVRACLRALQHQPDLARADLDEAWQIAEYGPMRLHIVDIYLHRARLFHDKEELKRARVVIEQCGYWRRKHELEAAEEDAKQWS